VLNLAAKYCDLAAKSQQIAGKNQPKKPIFELFLAEKQKT